MLKLINKSIRMDNTVNANKLAKLIIKMMNTITVAGNGVMKVILPITEINGIGNIECSLKGYKDGTNDYVHFVVCLLFTPVKHICYMLDTNKPDEDELTDEHIITFTTKLLETLPKLRLQRNGLVDLPNSGVGVGSEIIDLFGEIDLTENVKISNDTCSVCYDKTMTKTECNHSLCYRCWSKIPKERNNEAVPCPICRRDMRIQDNDEW